jgi:hypothetical protein
MIKPVVAEGRPPGRAAAMVSRALAGVALLVLAVASAIAFLVALGLIPPPAILAAAAQVGEAVSKVGMLDLLDRALIAAAAAVLGVAALSFLARRSPLVQRSAGIHVLQADENGLVVIGSASVESVATQTALQAAGVLNARVSVRGRPTGPVRLRIDVDVLPGGEVKRLGPRVQDAVRQSMEDLVGLTVRDVNVEVHVMDLDDLTGVMG